MTGTFNEGLRVLKNKRAVKISVRTKPEHYRGAGAD